MLMETLNATTPHYVRCIKPNDFKLAFSWVACFYISKKNYKESNFFFKCSFLVSVKSVNCVDWQVWPETCGAAAESLWRPGDDPHLCCRFPVQVLKRFLQTSLLSRPMLFNAKMDCNYELAHSRSVTWRLWGVELRSRYGTTSDGGHILLIRLLAWKQTIPQNSIPQKYLKKRLIE